MSGDTDAIALLACRHTHGRASAPLDGLISEIVTDPDRREAVVVSLAERTGMLADDGDLMVLVHSAEGRRADLAVAVTLGLAKEPDTTVVVPFDEMVDKLVSPFLGDERVAQLIGDQVEVLYLAVDRFGPDVDPVGEYLRDVGHAA